MAGLNETDPKGLVGLRKRISRRYFEIEKRGGSIYTTFFHAFQILEKVIKNKKLPKVLFRFVLGEIRPAEVPEAWGFNPDPKIAELVIVFNRLGVPTISSCEGHLNRNEPFPAIDFNNEHLFRVFAYIKDWKEIVNPSLKIRASPFEPSEFFEQSFTLFFDTGDLKKSQELVQKLVNYLKRKVYKTISAE